MKLARGSKLVLASHNKGKVAEFRALLEPYGIVLVSAGELGLPEPEETGKTFEANAILKAEAAAKASGLPALADDSGLSVNALDGAPGIYSARWAGETKDFRAAMKRIESELRLKATPDKSAFFTCALAIAAKGETTQSFQGVVHGDLVFPPRGDKGFGYDPIFVPHDGDEVDEEGKTYGEIDPAKKDKISHRALAFELFVEECLS